MTKDDAIQFFGTRAELARQLGINASNVPKWTAIPNWHQKSIERLTRGKLKADKIEDPFRNLKRLSYFIPKKNYVEFKKMCKKQKTTMRFKLNEMIEKELSALMN